MTHDMRTTNEMMSDNEQPLELSAELRGEVLALFAPMDRSLASSVTAAIGMRRSRRRLLQGLWLGFSPVMAVAIVAVPVSYTHLRAHETRHDLVCRLLLEKKKNENNIIC